MNRSQPSLLTSTVATTRLAARSILCTRWRSVATYMNFLSDVRPTSRAAQRNVGDDRVSVAIDHLYHFVAEVVEAITCVRGQHLDGTQEKRRPRGKPVQAHVALLVVFEVAPVARDVRTCDVEIAMIGEAVRHLCGPPAVAGAAMKVT